MATEAHAEHGDGNKASSVEMVEHLSKDEEKGKALRSVDTRNEGDGYVTIKTWVVCGVSISSSRLRNTLSGSSACHSPTLYRFSPSWPSARSRVSSVGI